MPCAKVADVHAVSQSHFAWHSAWPHLVCGHPRLHGAAVPKTWVAMTRPAMTRRFMREETGPVGADATGASGH
ncbi:hypothetical protein J4G37_18065 [Microvirga sp. 3-52]|nr:hypothetical protein [Microvirga sp. 3-52]